MNVMANTLVNLLLERAQELPEERSYTFLAGGNESESLTFTQLHQRARAIGARLQQLGAKGERALLLYPSGTEYIAAFYGCLSARTVAVPGYPPRVNHNLKRLESIMDDARPMAALTTEAIYRQLRGRFEESPGLARLDWIFTDRVPLEEAEAWVDPNATADTLAFLQYTSASTSAPKGVMVSHGNILHNQILMKEAVQHDRNTVIVSWLPLFHDMGLISVVLASLYNGVPCYLVAPVDFLKKPRLWLDAVSRYRGTFSGAPDFGYQLCVEKITPEERASLDLSSWRVAFNGSEPVRAETLRRFTEAFASCGLRREAMFPCYGLAENTLFATGRFHEGPTSFSRGSLELDRPMPARGPQSTPLVSCGSALLDTRVVIADAESRRRCGEREIGEIWLASPSVAQGYWDQPETTEYTFRARLTDGDGPFMRTGDLGFLHKGELYVTGRIKDLIIMRGRNIAPQDIEQAVERCDPALRPAFVAAVSVEAGGAERLVIIAEVRREARRDLDTAAVITRIRSAVAAEFAVAVSAVVLLRPGGLPKTSSGKTQRALVRQEFLTGALSSLAAWRDEAVLNQTGVGSRESGAVAPTAVIPPLTPRVDSKEPSLTASVPDPRLATHRVASRERINSVTTPDPRLPAPVTPNQMESWLAEHIAARVKLSPEKINRNASILVYGLDSVVVAALVGEIEQTFDVELDIEQLFDGNPSLRELAARIRVDAPRERPAPRVAQVIPIATSRPKLALAPPAGHTAPAPLPDHPFRTCVNPELGRLLSQMGMDKTFVRGEGSWLWDETGRRYLDFLAQYGALPFGFNPPRIWAALNAVREGGEPSFVQPSYLNAAGELAKRLLAVAPPGMGYVTFANSGAEAIEAAIKLCRSTTGRHDILAAANGFHGKTLGALSATDKEKYQKPFGAPVPGFDYVPYGDLEALRGLLATGRYAAFLIEPVQGEGGIVEPPAGYLRQARKACREAGTLFVADEIQTGLGRTGAMFVCSELGITPDVMTVAKALGGGLMPIGACLSTVAAYNDEFALKHTSTFAGNTLACRAGLATLDLLEENGGALISRVAENGARLKEALHTLSRRYPGLIGDVRGRGYLLGMRFGLDRHSVATGLLGYLGEQEALTALAVSHLLQIEGVRVGYTLNHGGVLRIEPPLTATWDECEYFLQALERVLLRIGRRDMAALTAQVTGFEATPSVAGIDKPGIEIALAIPEGRAKLEPHPGDGRFAFLVHPLTWKDYADIDGSLSVLSDDQIATLSAAIADNFDPLVIGETRIVGENGKAAYGEFILVPRRAEELRAMPHQKAVAEIMEAVKLARKRGARIVGLGAYTSVVTQGGLSLKGNGSPPLTTGNSYTVIAARQTIRLAAAERGWSLPRRTVAVVGAGGSIGQALSILLAHDAGRLILLGNPSHAIESREHLLQVAGRIVWTVSQVRGSAEFHPGSVASWVAELDFDLPARPDRAGLVRLGEELIRRTGAVAVSVDANSYLPEVDVVVCCTSTTERLISEDNLRRSAVVCDVSRPSNVASHVRTRRPDVMVLDGGVVRLPGGSSLGFNASLAKGSAYACMAETMMLAMEHRYQDTGLGFDLPLEQVLEMERLAGELGFRVLLNQTNKNSERVEEEPADPFVRAGSVRA